MTKEENDEYYHFLRALFSDFAEAEQLVKINTRLLHLRSSLGETAFHYLIIEAELEGAKRLADWGSDINTQDDFGMTPLMHAVTIGNLDAVRWLISRGASLEHKSKIDETALSLATSNETAAIFQVLIACPRKHPIAYYYSDLKAQLVVESEELVMKDYLVSLGLVDPYECDF